MSIRVTLCALAAAIFAATFAVSAFAQQPGRIRGQIEKADGAMLVLKLRDGKTMNVKLADDVRVGALTKASVADIKNDSFIGIAGMPQPDGSIQAFSIHMFMAAQRGVVADRHGDWDAKPGSTMTNAYVESVVKSNDGETMMVKYKEGEKKIIVTPQTVIAATGPGSKDELKPGAQVIIMASQKEADGTVLAKVMYVGRGGMKPAM